MAARSAVLFYAFGLRLKQASVLTRVDAYSADARFVRAIVERLLSAINDLLQAKILNPHERNALEALRKACGTMLRRSLRDQSDEYLEGVYANLNQQLLLTCDSIKHLLSRQKNKSRSTWFDLGTELADGWHDERAGHGRRSRADAWRVANPQRLLELQQALGLDRQTILPAHGVELEEAEWMSELPESYSGWDRVEAGLIAVARNATEDLPTKEETTVKKPPKVYGTDQQRILEALDGRALTKEKLATEICGGDSRRITRGIKELMDDGVVANNRKLPGYYRPDAPPNVTISPKLPPKRP